jgi:hypothetical protein
MLKLLKAVAALVALLAGQRGHHGGLPSKQIVELHVPQSALDQYQAHQDADNDLKEAQRLTDRKRLFVEVGTLIFAIFAFIGSVVSVFYLRAGTNATIQAVKQSQTATEIDQRAFLFVDAALDAEPTQFGPMKPGPFFVPTVTFPVTNTGKTPALRALMTAKVLFSAQVPKEPDWANEAKGQRVMDRETAKRLGVNPETFTRTVTIFPGDRQRFFEPVFPMGGPNLYAAYGRKDELLYIWVRLDYCDVFKKAHWTKACMSHAYGDTRLAFPYCFGGGLITDDGESTPSDYVCKQEEGERNR